MRLEGVVGKAELREDGGDLVVRVGHPGKRCTEHAVVKEEEAEEARAGRNDDEEGFNSLSQQPSSQADSISHIVLSLYTPDRIQRDRR
jgi:hypothetical protein